MRYPSLDWAWEQAVKAITDSGLTLFPLDPECNVTGAPGGCTGVTKLFAVATEGKNQPQG